MSLAKKLLFASLPLVAAGSLKRATPSSFQLYAYGNGLGGLPMFNADGYAYVGDPNLSNGTDAAQVVFSPGTNNMWIGAPNTTDRANATTPSWTNVTLFVPTPSAADGRVGFLDGGNSSTGNVITAGFVFYGSTAMLTTDDGELETLWTGLPMGDTGVHALYWNDTSQGQVPITMRRIAPSSPTVSQS